MLRKIQVLFTKNLETSKNGGLMQALFLVIITIRYGIITIIMLRIFYNILHLDREFRDHNFKQNLEQKLRIIGRAEELTKDEDNNIAFRELQMLHKMWKEEIGPVAKEFSDEIWDKFSAATKIIHDKRQLYIEELEKKAEENVTLKKELIIEINTLTETAKNKGHQAWQNTIKKVQELRDQFFESGKVPRSKNKEIWNLFQRSNKKL